LAKNPVQPAPALPVVVAESAQESAEKPEKSADSEPDKAEQKQENAAENQPDGENALEAQKEQMIQQSSALATAAMAGQKPAADNEAQEPEEKPAETGQNQAQNADTIRIGNREFSPLAIGAGALIIGICGAICAYLICM
jgi:hypothetical protein